MRAFLSVRLPESVLGSLAAVQQSVERGAPGFYRWARPEQMHLTLYFLGTVGDVGPVVEAVARVASGAFTIGVEGLLLFPEPRVPKILAAGVAGDVGALRRLQQRVSDAVFPLAENKETRAFSPHVTIGRLKPGMPGTAKALKGALARTSLGASSPFLVDAIELVGSTPGAGGSTYESLHRFGLV